MGILRRGLARFRMVSGTSRLAAEKATLLSQMRAENAAATHRHYQPGPGLGWQKLVREFNDLFHTEGIADVQAQPYNARFSSFPPGNKAYYYYAAFQLFRSLKESDFHGVFEKLRATQEKYETNTVAFDGLHLTWDALLSVQNLLAIAEKRPDIFSEPCTVLDLGAGWGRIGHVLLRVNPRATYIIADLPETLLIAETYLPTTLRNVASYGYAHHRGRDFDKKLLLSEPGFHFIGTHMLPRFADKSLDAFINIASFQEMPNGHVAAYFDEADRLTSGAFYILQDATPNRKGGFTATYPYKPGWKPIFNRPSRHLPDYFESLHAIR